MKQLLIESTLKVKLKMFRSTSSFDRLLERATSHLLLEPDWNAILAICDTIRSGDVAPKYAVTAIKKKFYHDNPHVVLYALQVILLRARGVCDVFKSEWMMIRIYLPNYNSYF